MSITTWDALKVAPESRKMAVIKIVPKEMLKVIWTLDGEFSDNTETLDSCDAITGWTNSADATAPTLDTVNKKEGTASINLGKSGTSTNQAFYEKTLGATFDGTGDEYRVWIKVKDKSVLQDGVSGGLPPAALEIAIGSDSSNAFIRFIGKDDLKDVDNDGTDGWNNLGDLISNFNPVNSPVITALDYLKVVLFTPNASDLIVSGNIKMDFHRLLLNPVNKYSTSLDTYHGSDIDDVEKDGTVMTRAANAAALESTPVDEFFYDIPNETLFINIDIDDDPHGNDYVVNHLLYFSNDSTFRLEIDTDDAKIIPDPRVESVPRIKHSNKGATFGLNLPAKANLKLNNLDGKLDIPFNDYEWTDSDITVFLGGEDLPFSEYQTIYTGRIVRDIKWTRSSVSIQIEDRRARALQRNPLNTYRVIQTISPTVNNFVTGEFVGMDHKWRNKPAPRLYGQRLDYLPVMGLNNGYVLSTPMDTTQTLMQLTAVATFVNGVLQTLTQIPGTGTLFIGSEKMTYTYAGPGNAPLTVVRGVDNTTATAHVAGEQVTIINSTLNFMNYTHFVGLESATPVYQIPFVDNNIFATGLTVGFDFYRNQSNEIAPGIDYDGGITASTGDLLGSMIKTFLNDMGIPDAELDTASFTALDSLINNSTPGYFFNWDVKGEEALDIMLSTGQAWLVTDSDGKLELRHFDPVIDVSALIDLNESDIQSWAPRWDSTRMRTQVKISFGRQYNLTGEKEWISVEGTNKFDGIIPVEEKELELETAEYNEGCATELRDHIMAMTLNKQERVKINTLLLEFAEKRPGDRIRINFARPWGNVDRILELDAVTINMATGGVNIELQAHNIFGLDDTIGGWAGDAAPDWDPATDTEKIEQGFWTDDNGFIDAADADTKNRKGWY